MLDEVLSKEHIATALFFDIISPFRLTFARNVRHIEHNRSDRQEVTWLVRNLKFDKF